MLPTQLSAAVHYTLEYVPTRQWLEGFSKLWEIHYLAAPPLYIPVGKGYCPHSNWFEHRVLRAYSVGENFINEIDQVLFYDELQDWLLAVISR